MENAPTRHLVSTASPGTGATAAAMAAPGVPFCRRPVVFIATVMAGELAATGKRSALLEASDVFVLEERLHDVLDSLVTECVVAYFDRATSELAHKARHDALTDLLDHAAFTRELELELERAKRYGSGVTLVYFDLDDFKELNDSQGHQSGDRALQQVARLLREEIRRSDLAGRMGGDEFAALLVESDERTGETFLGRLETRISELVDSGGLPATVGLSAGVTRYPDDGEDAETLFAVADLRLYEAKRASAA